MAGQFANPGMAFGSELNFRLPSELEAGEPPEARGLPRDRVRLMVSFLSENRVEHARFSDLPRYLLPGDVLVINTSGTLNAALKVIRQDGSPLELHLSTRLPADLWVIELRRPNPAGSQPFYEAQPGEQISLPGGASGRLLIPYRPDQRDEPGDENAKIPGGVRLWIASLHLPSPVDSYLAVHGFPIRYKYVRDGWPLTYYQTVYAKEMGSAEMPSAGRAFTHQILKRLEKKGVKIVSLVLHTGVASLESHEPPYEEYFKVPVDTARAVNEAHAAGSRVIAVGTTVVRALETQSEESGLVHPGEGWTRLVITPQRGVHAINGLLTGLHEPRSTHLAMLEAVAGAEPLKKAYDEALCCRYLWHEFGDLHLILP